MKLLSQLSIAGFYIFSLTYDKARVHISKVRITGIRQMQASLHFEDTCNSLEKQPRIPAEPSSANNTADEGSCVACGAA